MKNIFELTIPCHFGLEAPLKREITDLGYDVSKVEDGRVYLEGDAEAIVRSNISLRTAERVLINIGSFKAESFEELFTKTKELEWENFIPKDARFNVVKASSVKSKLFSPSDIQSIMKKAIVERLKKVYHVDWFEETGINIPIRVFIHKDEVSIGLDTTGDSLHKRGYRKLTAKAPIAENLAAALLMLTPWKGDRILVDPFCGSGTFPIEAALMAANIAPGMNRGFNAESWTHIIDRREWKEVREEAREMVRTDIETNIQGYDIDEEMIKIARANAKLAGVENLIHFQRKGVDELSSAKKYGFIITNPPYGERLEDKEKLAPLYKTIAQRYKELDSWSLYMITSYEDAEKAMAMKAEKNRKIYNGMLKTYFYQFPGPKPPKKNSNDRKDI